MKTNKKKKKKMNWSASIFHLIKVRAKHLFMIYSTPFANFVFFLKFHSSNFDGDALGERWLKRVGESWTIEAINVWGEMKYEKMNI